MTLPGQTLPARVLGPRLRRLSNLGFSFRIARLAYHTSDHPVVMRAAMLVCYGAEDIVAEIELGIYSTDELIATCENVCDIHRWTRSRSHPTLVKLDKE